MRVLLLSFLAACSTRGLTNPDPPRDAIAPTLDVRAPLRGTIAAGATEIEVRGVAADADSGLDRVLVNGVPAQLGADGSFVAKVPALPGLTLLHTEVRDQAGNTQSDTRAVLGGHLAPIDTTVPSALYAHVDGRSLMLVGAAASAALTDLDLGQTAAALNPIVNFAGVRVDVAKAKKGKVTVDVTPDRDGLNLDAEIDDLEVDLHVTYDVLGETGDTDAKLTAKAFHVGAILSVTAGAGGTIQVTTSQTNASFDGFALASDLPDKVDALIEGPLGDVFAGLIADEVDSAVPGLLGKLIGGEQRIEVDGQTLSITLTPTQLHVDASGLDVALDAKVYIPGNSGITFLMDGATPPPLDAARPFRAALADDEVNQILTALWGVGLMDQTFTVDAGSYAGVGKLFDEVEVALRLPPVITALPGNAGLQVSLGDVECAFHRNGAVVTRLSLSAQIALTAGISKNQLSLTAADPVVWLDVLSDGVAGGNPFDHESVQALGSFTARALVGVITKDLAQVPITSVDGIQIANAAVATGAGGYIVVTADLVGP